METSFENSDYIDVLCCGCHSFLVVDLPVDVNFLDVGTWGNFDGRFHSGG